MVTESARAGCALTVDVTLRVYKFRHLGQSQIAANEAISGVKTDPSELKDEFKPGAA